MPRIPEKHLNCTIYLYPTKRAADRGASYGGSGFLFAIPFEQNAEGAAPRAHVYAVTNHHVIMPKKGCGNSRVVRLNTIDGGQKKLSYDDWTHDWEEDDLALYRPNSIQTIIFLFQMP
ncbi:MAG: hypothetical protein H6671_10140 [Anaerolineaceae bacterium]|nr:hypothetical protein [Anaerolineaceae bacterium]